MSRLPCDRLIARLASTVVGPRKRKRLLAARPGRTDYIRLFNRTEFRASFLVWNLSFWSIALGGCLTGSLVPSFTSIRCPVQHRLESYIWNFGQIQKDWYTDIPSSRGFHRFGSDLNSRLHSTCETHRPRHSCVDSIVYASIHEGRSRFFHWKRWCFSFA